MRYIVLLLLLLGAQFCLTAFAPAKAGKGWVLWPFATDSKPFFKFAGGLPQQPGSVLTAILAGLAGLGFLAAAVGLFGVVPANWWPILAVMAAIASTLLHILYLSPLAILPIVVNLVLLWGVLLQHWTVIGLRGG